MEQPKFRQINLCVAKIDGQTLNLTSKSELDAYSDEELTNELNWLKDDILDYDVIITDDTIWYDINYTDETQNKPIATYLKMLKELSALQREKEAVNGHIGFELIKNNLLTDVANCQVIPNVKSLQLMISNTIQEMVEDNTLYIHSFWEESIVEVCKHISELIRNEDVSVLLVSNNVDFLEQVENAITPVLDLDDESEGSPLSCCRGDDIIGLTECMKEIKNILKKRKEEKYKKEEKKKEGNYRTKNNNFQKKSKKSRQYRYKYQKKYWRNDNGLHHDSRNWLERIGFSIDGTKIIVAVIILIGIIALSTLIWRCTHENEDNDLTTPKAELIGYYTFGEIHGSSYDNIQSAVITYSEPIYLLWVMENGNEQYHKFWLASGDTLKSETLGMGFVQRDGSDKVTLLFTKGNQQWLIKRTSK